MVTKWLSRGCARVLAIGGSAAVVSVSSASSGASEEVVLPAHVHAAKVFQNGTFKTSQLTDSAPKRAYLVAVRQPVADSWIKRADDWNKIAASRRTFAGSEAKSPFAQKITWAGYSFRRMCVYMYSKPFAGRQGAPSC